MILKRSVRIVKKVRLGGRWKFVSLERRGARYAWDSRPGAYFLDWHEAGRRRCEFAGHTPAQALEGQRRKQAGLAGGALLNGRGADASTLPPTPRARVEESPQSRTSRKDGIVVAFEAPADAAERPGPLTLEDGVETVGQI